MPTSGNDAAAQAIRLLLAAYDKNQAWLAAQIGESAFWIGRRQRNLTNWDIEDLGRVAKVFGIDVPTLLELPSLIPGTLEVAA